MKGHSGQLKRVEMGSIKSENYGWSAVMDQHMIKWKGRERGCGKGENVLVRCPVVEVLRLLRLMILFSLARLKRLIISSIEQLGETFCTNSRDSWNEARKDE
uniref:Ovule protein n=1 Tax=Elaeophora elaphi TaxID=1147741 RepID=A0A0R3S6T2_9BILA